MTTQFCKKHPERLMNDGRCSLCSADFLLETMGSSTNDRFFHLIAQTVPARKWMLKRFGAISQQDRDLGHTKTLRIIEDAEKQAILDELQNVGLKVALDNTWEVAASQGVEVRR